MSVYQQPYDVIALLAGKGTRMKGCEYSSKHLTPINGLNLVERMKGKISDLENGGYNIENKYAVVNSESAGEMMNILGGGWTYHLQKTINGIAKAMIIPNAKNPYILYLGDQFFEEPIGKLLEGFSDSEETVRMWLKNTAEYYNHTTVNLNSRGVKSLIEKPPRVSGMSRYVATGIWLFKPHINKYITKIEPDLKGEYNLADLVTQAMKKGEKVGYRINEGYWVDVGTPEKVVEAEKLAKEYAVVEQDNYLKEYFLSDKGRVGWMKKK